MARQRGVAGCARPQVDSRQGCRIACDGRWQPLELRWQRAGSCPQGDGLACFLHGNEMAFQIRRRGAKRGWFAVPAAVALQPGCKVRFFSAGRVFRRTRDKS